MSEAQTPWAVVEELTIEAYERRIADGAVDVYTDGERYFRVFNYNEGNVPAPDQTKFEDHSLTVLTNPELISRMAAYFRARFTGAAEAA